MADNTSNEDYYIYVQNRSINPGTPLIPRDIVTLIRPYCEYALKFDPQQLNHRHFVKMPIPDINSWEDLLKQKDAILSAIRANPFVDWIYCLPHRNTLPFDLEEESYIAGSKAASMIVNILKQLDDTIVGRYDTLPPHDIDIFKIGAPGPDRYFDPESGRDYVHSPFPNITAVLLQFDLACCRAAVNADSCWMSAHFLASLFTGTYYLPAYLQDLSLMIFVYGCFHESVQKECKRKFTSRFDPEYVEFMYKRIKERTAKYEQRGYLPIWIATNTLPKWLMRRFDYTTMY